MKTIVVALLFLFALPAQAGPKKRILIKFAVAGAAAGVHAYGLHHCRQGRVERCDGQYGAAWGIFGVATGLNFAMIPVSEKLPVKEGYAFSFAGSAAQLGHGIYEWRIRPEQVRH